MLWVTLNSHWVFAMKLKPLSRNFGGAKKGKKGRSIGWEELTKSKLEGGVEFRDIAMFNDSLLAKQVWWLLKNSDSLFPKVFKAHFFPNCTFMEAKHTSGGSHAWNSILHGRDVLLRGCQWRIGNGKAVSIWQNQWLPRENPPSVLSPTVETLADAKVEILIDENIRQWNYDLIDSIFTLWSIIDQIHTTLKVWGRGYFVLAIHKQWNIHK